MSFKLLTKQNSEFLCLKGSYTFKMQCWKSHVEVHMYVLQYMHVYTVNIDDTLYLQLVPLKLNISTCYWCSFLRINTLGQSTRLGMSVTTQGGSGRQYVTGPGRNISKYRFVLLNVYRFGRFNTQLTASILFCLCIFVHDTYLNLINPVEHGDCIQLTRI